jgi:carbonic anhydrase
MRESAWGPHTAELAVICCVDDRVQEAAAQYVRTRLSPRFFWYALPGGALAVTEHWAMISQGLRIAVQQGVKRIAVIAHTDCAAFPGFSNEEEERQTHRESLLTARSLLQRESAAVEVICILLRGRWQVEEV